MRKVVEEIAALVGSVGRRKGCFVFHCEKVKMVEIAFALTF
jgi:hypothetical protein